MCLVVFSAALIVSAAEESETVVILTYDEARDMILDEMLALQDMDIIIRDMQLNRRFLTDEVERLERSGTSIQLHMMRETLQSLDSSIRGAQGMQEQMSAATSAWSERMTDAINAVPGEKERTALAIAMAGITGTSAGDGGMSVMSMQTQRSDLNREVARMMRPENVREMTRDARRNLNEYDRQIEILRMNRVQAELSMESALRGMIAGAEDLERLAQMSDAGIALMEQNLHRMTVMHSVGLVSTNALTASRHSLAQDRVRLNELKRGQQNLLHNMNYSMGQPLLQETIIEFERDEFELPEDFEEHIKTILPELHSIKMSQFELDRALDARWVYTGHQNAINVSIQDRQRALDPNRVRRNRDLWSTEPTSEDEEIDKIRNRIALQEAVERATASHQQTLRTAEATLLKGFSDYVNLLAKHESLLLDIELAQDELEIAITNFDLGRVTKFEIAQAEMNLFRLESELEGVLTQKWLLAFKLENPALLQ
jgi:hypothetical protein